MTRQIRIVHGELRMGSTCWWCERDATTSAAREIVLPPAAGEAFLLGAIGTALTADERRLPIPVPSCDVHVGPMSAVGPREARAVLVFVGLALLALAAAAAVGSALGAWKVGVGIGVVLTVGISAVGERLRPLKRAGLDFAYGKEPGKHPVLTSSEPDPHWIARQTPGPASTAPYR